MIAAVRLALGDVLSPPFRAALLKTLALTIALMAAAWAGIEWLVATQVALPWPWLDTVLTVLAGVGLVFAMGFLVAPVAALVAGLFLDEIAARVEAVHYPADPPGRGVPGLRSLLLAAQFLLVVLLVNAIALPLAFLLGLGFLIFLVANAYLLGREYFEFAALRFHDEAMATQLRRAHAGQVFAGGLAIAAFVAIPVVNLATPLFAAALMVHLHKRLARQAA